MQEPWVATRTVLPQDVLLADIRLALHPERPGIDLVFMPYEWSFDGNILRASAFGVFTTAEALQFLQEAATAESARGATVHRLSDLRQVTEFAMDYSAMRKIAARRAETRTKSAMLTRNAMQYGMVRMFQTLLEDSGAVVEIFSDEAAARKWLAKEPALPPD